MKFFLDNNIPPRLARALHELVRDDGHEVVHLRDRYPPGTSDNEWIKELGKEGGWAVLTRDDAIRRKPHELAALREARLTTFFLARAWKDLSRWEIAWKLVKWWPDLMKAADLVASGAGFIVKVGGKLEQVIK